MKFLFLAVLAVVVAVGAALVALPDPGYVLIGWGNRSVETTVVVLILAMVVLYIAVRLLAGLRRMPGGLIGWGRRRRASRARNALNLGLIEFAEGRWGAAERHLARQGAKSDSPLISYLTAARAAQRQGAPERRDDYLRLAHESTPEAELAVGLSQAELQIQHGQFEQALATLERLRGVAPKHVYVLALLRQTLEALEDWSALHDLVPELRRRKVVSDGEADELLCRTHRELMEAAAAASDPAALHGLWESAHKRCSQDGELLLAYARHLQPMGALGDAEPVLRAAIRKRWDPRLVYLFGQIEGGGPGQRMTEAEGWLPRHADDPVLLLTLGRLALQNRLWGKARTHLEASAELNPNMETYQLLGALLEQLGEPAKATAAYRRGMELAVGVPLIGKRGSDVLGAGDQAADRSPEPAPAEDVPGAGAA